MQTFKDSKALQLLIALVVLVALVLVHVFLREYYLEQQSAKQTERVDVYRNSLFATLSRHDYLPGVLSKNDALFDKAFNEPEQASQILESIRSASEADFIYIMAADGTTIASSNWDQETSFVGEKYGFRPYFTQAVAHGSGDFFGIGATTNIAGYFVSARYPETGPVKAITAVKVNSSTLDKSWKGSEEEVFVSDKNGVVILSSSPKWRYKSLRAISQLQRDEISAQRQFGDETLEPLGLKTFGDSQSLVTILNTKYLQTTTDIGKMGWELHYLVPYSVVQSQLVLFWSKAIILALMGVAALLLMRMINAHNALRDSQGESSKLRELNCSLEHEIIERKQVEVALRKAETDLRRTSKLTAMGQLSASITHELGQPLSAMRTYIASLGAHSSQETQDKTLGKLAGLVERMISITQQLRYFARSGDKEIRRVNLKDTIQGALNSTQPAIQAANVTLDIQQQDKPVNVLAGSVRMEQVLVNLIRNALDAMQENSPEKKRQLLIRLSTEHNQAVLTVEDSGPGISEEAQKMLYEPFYSTKPSGIGMGLGLAISTNIVAELEGSLCAENRPEGGARFVVTVPLLLEQ
jgi:two-component system C4-dicarboxylate transport sensor histidine kinase DctB